MEDYRVWQEETEISAQANKATPFLHTDCILRGLRPLLVLRLT